MFSHRNIRPERQKHKQKSAESDGLQRRGLVGDGHRKTTIVPNDATQKGI